MFAPTSSPWRSGSAGHAQDCTQRGIDDHRPDSGSDVVPGLVSLLQHVGGGGPVGLVDQPRVQLAGQCGPPLDRGLLSSRLEPRPHLASLDQLRCRHLARVGVPRLDGVAQNLAGDVLPDVEPFTQQLHPVVPNLPPLVGKTPAIIKRHREKLDALRPLGRAQPASESSAASTSASVEYRWNDARNDPARDAARIPADESRRSAPGTSAATIALSDADMPNPARKRLASRTLCSRIRSTPTCSRSSSAGAVPTQQCQAGDTSKRRASSASRSGGP